MKRTLVITSIVGLMSAGVITAQDQQEMARRQAVELAAQGGFTRTALETRVTQGKPYSGEAVTEFVQVLGDGNRIVRTSSARLWRDSEGRTRREEVAEKGPEKNTVVITDPVAGISLILDAGTRTARKSAATFARMQAGSYTITTRTPEVAGQVQALPPKVEVITMSADGSRAMIEQQAAQGGGRGGRGGAVSTFSVAGGAVAVGRGGSIMAVREPGETTKEDLGQQVVEGVSANGTRTTTVIPTGAIGNEQPITIVSEQWFSPDLEMLVLTRHSDPRTGESTYRLTNITRNEPDRSLFQPPADYTIQELKPPVVWQQRQQQ